MPAVETVRAITTDGRGRVIALQQTIDTTNQQIAELQAFLTAFQASVNQKISDLQLLTLQIQQSLG